jgi:hypothetical protein
MTKQTSLGRLPLWQEMLDISERETTAELRQQAGGNAVSEVKKTNSSRLLQTGPKPKVPACF